MEDNVLLLAPSFGWFKGQYQLPKTTTTVELDGKEVDKTSVTTPRSKLMTDKYPVDDDGVAWKKRFQRLASRQSRLIEKYSVPFPIRGVRIVPKRVGEDFFRELEDIKLDLQDAADAFVRDLSKVIEQIREHTDKDVFKAIEARIPRDRNVMRAKFYIDVVPVEMAGGQSDPSVVTEQALAQHYNIVREACQRKVEEAVESMIEQPREQLAEALEGLKDVINRSGRVSTKSFRPVYEAISKIRAFSFVANQQLMDEIGKLENRLNNTVPSTLDRTTAANNGFTAAVDALMREVEDAEQQAADMEEFGREYRGIQLD